MRGGCHFVAAKHRGWNRRGLHPPIYILTLFDGSCKDEVAKLIEVHGQALDNPSFARSRILMLGIPVRKRRRQEPERRGWTRERIAAVVLRETRDRAAIRGIRAGDRERLTKRLNCARQSERPASQSSLRRHTDQRKPERGSHCGSFTPNVFSRKSQLFSQLSLVGSYERTHSPLSE